MGEVWGIELACGTEAVSKVDIAFWLLPHPAMKDAIRKSIIAYLSCLENIAIFSYIVQVSA